MVTRKAENVLITFGRGSIPPCKGNKTSGNLTGFHAEFDEFLKMILWSMHSSSIPLLSYEGVVPSSKNVEKTLLKK